VAGVWRVVLSPRWILWHLLAILAVAVCVVAAVWQWHRAGSALGSALNVGYGIQWPIFAVFFAYMWWRFLRMELLEHREDPADGTAGAPEPAETASSVQAATTPPEPGGDPARTAGSSRAAGTDEPGRTDVDPPLPWGATPFTRSPVAAPAPVTDEEAPGLAEYNRMLAGLAARDAAADDRGRETADGR
jgi:DNA-binding transcriptional regulator of glucitol operon